MMCFVDRVVFPRVLHCYSFEGEATLADSGTIDSKVNSVTCMSSQHFLRPFCLFDDGALLGCGEEEQSHFVRDR